MKTMMIAGLALAGAGLMGADSKEPVVHGQYVEARTCDVWTGPCFSNSDLNIKGKEAVAGWAVDQGAWDGQKLDGLKVVAVLLSEGTLHTEFQGKVRAALYVDEKATDAQAKALVSLAKTLAPDHLADVVAVERGAITLARTGLKAELAVGSLVKVRTGEFGDGDAICCHEEQAYPPVSGGARIECAKTLENTYGGAALGTSRWTELNKRGSMVGRFSK